MNFHIINNGFYNELLSKHYECYMYIEETLVVNFIYVKSQILLMKLDIDGYIMTYTQVEKTF
jgi:hypothetical protein